MNHTEIETEDKDAIFNDMFSKLIPNLQQPRIYEEVDVHFPRIMLEYMITSMIADPEVVQVINDNFIILKMYLLGLMNLLIKSSMQVNT